MAPAAARRAPEPGAAAGAKTTVSAVDSALRVGGAVTLALAILAGCASLPAPVTEPALSGFDRPFTIDGRLSARRGADGVSGSFTWVHEPSRRLHEPPGRGPHEPGGAPDESGRDTIDLMSPLGQTLARLEGDREGVSLARPGERVETAPDWASLTERGLGVVIPVEGLASWIQGSPHAGSAARATRDDEGRLSTLRQNGWDVRYRYDDTAAAHPKRVTLAYPDSPPIELTIVIDRWQ